MKTCGTCEYAKIAVGLPLGGRLCKGAPPQAILVPAGQPGAWQMQCVWPPVTTSDEACGAYKRNAGEGGPYTRLPLPEVGKALDIARQVGEDESEIDGSHEGHRLMEALSGH